MAEVKPGSRNYAKKAKLDLSNCSWCQRAPQGFDGNLEKQLDPLVAPPRPKSDEVCGGFGDSYGVRSTEYWIPILYKYWAAGLGL
jgi:hypothetical protein